MSDNFWDQILSRIRLGPDICEVSCPLDTVCLDSGITLPREGYSRLSEISSEMTRCLNPSACLEGTLEAPMQNCKETYEGYLCGSCETDVAW